MFDDNFFHLQIIWESFGFTENDQTRVVQGDD